MDLHKTWPHRWLTSKVKSTEEAIHGLGIVAKSNISEDESVAVLGGVIIPKNEILKYRAHLGHVGIQISDDFFICPTEREELERSGVFNHSCNPNCGFVDSIMLVAIKDILLGEELTFDYAFVESFFDSFECKCKSSKCRKVIKSTDWKMKSLQEEYGDYFSPYLKLKFKK